MEVPKAYLWGDIAEGILFLLSFLPPPAKQKEREKRKVGRAGIFHNKEVIETYFWGIKLVLSSFLSSFL